MEVSILKLVNNVLFTFLIDPMNQESFSYYFCDMVSSYKCCPRGGFFKLYFRGQIYVCY